MSGGGGIKTWAACRCFTRRHIYLPSLNSGRSDVCEEASYVNYVNDQQFSRDYRHLLKEHDFDIILGEVKQEVKRRSNRFRVMEANRKLIKKLYIPKHKELFDESKMEIKDIHLKTVREDIFVFPLLDSKVCNILVEELDNFKKTKLEHSRPNSMNNYGVILEEMGLENIVEAIRAKIEPVVKVIYPDLVGDTGLDSAKAFTVDYNAEEASCDKDLATHFDNAEVTVNISLTSGHQEGELYFLEGDNMAWPLQHRMGWAVLHRGSVLHGAMPVTDGSRTNLIIWFRSSAVRNKRCPMCEELPQLEPVTESVEGINPVEESSRWRCRGDGFTV